MNSSLVPSPDPSRAAYDNMCEGHAYLLYLQSFVIIILCIYTSSVMCDILTYMYNIIHIYTRIYSSTYICKAHMELLTMHSHYHYAYKAPALSSPLTSQVPADPGVEYWHIWSAGDHICHCCVLLLLYLL